MTIWNKIYNDYQKGGKAWATLSEGIHPLFKSLLMKSRFDHKHALDIGCGTGKYAVFLKKKGFAVDGIDSSDTAIRMTKKALGKNVGRILKSDMFRFRIPKDKYDLIISVATIQHGLKKNIQKLITQIHSSLTKGGKVFISLPDYESSKKWDTFQNHKNLGSKTFAPMSGPEKGLPHSFYTKAEAQKLFAKFRIVKISLDSIGRWIIQAKK